MWDSCNIHCKDTNLKAIHNSGIYIIIMMSVAISTAKIQIWKQFTTLFGRNLRLQRLQYPLQRYKFESNSQHALHLNLSQNVAISTAKIQIWKQFTTLTNHFRNLCKLQYPLQRYKFESNSQLSGLPSLNEDCCNIHCKDTNLKAIHNPLDVVTRNGSVAISTAKIQIWKQFTTLIRINITG